MAFQQVLLDGQSIGAGEVKRLLPDLDVSKWDRLHFHISGGIHGIRDTSVTILFGTPVDGKVLLADSTVWYEESVSEREFSHTTPNTYIGTGFIMSVPVVAPTIFDVIVKNVGEQALKSVYVTVMAQEI